MSTSLFLTLPIVTLVLSATNAFALSTREEALRENSTIDEKAYRKTIQASEAQQAKVESFLKLEDPSLELRDRPWLWLFSFRLQNMQPAGTGHVADTKYGLSTYGAGLMPSIDIGMLYDAVQRPAVKWSTGLSAHAGAMSQTTELKSSSGFAYKDARLNTMVLSGVWNNRFQRPELPRWTASINPEIGAINYTQSSATSSLANFSQQNSFWGLGLGLEYSFSKKWALAGQYSRRTAGSGNIALSDIQKDSFEVGTTVVW